MMSREGAGAVAASPATPPETRGRQRYAVSAALLTALAVPLLAHANEFVVGRETPLRIAVDPVGRDPCNIEVLLPDGSRIERELMPPDFETVVGYTPRNEGPQTVYWEGRFRFKGSLSVSGCEGRHSRRIEVQPSAEQIRQRWDGFFAGMPTRQRECIEYGTGRVIVAGVTPPSSRLENPYDPAVQRITNSCQRFANMQLRAEVLCPVGKGGQMTRCADHYALGNKVLDADAALRAAAGGATLTLVLREPDNVRSQRLDAERVAREKAAADEAARVAAEEKARAKAEDDARKKVEADAQAAADAEKAKLAEIQRRRNLRCFAGRCI